MAVPSVPGLPALATVRAFVAAAWDVVARLWLVTSAWLGLGRSASRQLAQITDPQRFLGNRVRLRAS